jgi:hypothetical protein
MASAGSACVYADPACQEPLSPLPVRAYLQGSTDYASGPSPYYDFVVEPGRYVIRVEPPSENFTCPSPVTIELVADVSTSVITNCVNHSL